MIKDNYFIVKLLLPNNKSLFIYYFHRMTNFIWSVTLINSNVACEICYTTLLRSGSSELHTMVYKFRDEFFLSERFEELFGYGTKNNTGDMDADWAGYFYPDDRKAIIKGINDAIASHATYWENTCRFVKANGSVIRAFNRASIIRNQDGKATRIIGVMHDISRQMDGKAASEPTYDKKAILIEQIKNIIVDLVHYSDEQLQMNFSDYLSKELKYDYTYLSNLFSEAEGIPIQKFIIAQKIERVKELIMTGELTLTQIALKLHYSSIAHLSNQFKKVTGLTPSYFKQLQ